MGIYLCAIVKPIVERNDIDSAIIIHDKVNQKSFLNLNNCVFNQPHVEKLQTIISNFTENIDILALGYTGMAKGKDKNQLTEHNDIWKAPSDYILSDNIVLHMTNLKFNKAISKSKSNQIDQVWLDGQKERGDALVNGTILNLDKYTLTKEQLDIECSLVEYKYYFSQKIGKIPLGITPLAVSGITYIEENSAVEENTNTHFYIGRRSPKVTQYPNFFELIPSGSIDQNSLSKESDNIDYMKQLYIELAEELGAEQADVKSSAAFCLIYDSQDKVYDIGIKLALFSMGTFNTSKSDEYNNIRLISLESLEAEIIKGDVVPTSKSLFSAFKESHIMDRDA